MENPVKILREEHEILLDGIEIAKKIQKIKDDKKYRKSLHDLILFFRNFTEIFHHPKEEKILYPIIKHRAEKMNDRFMYELCDNHEDFKSLMAEIENHYSNHDYRLLRKTMDIYLREMSLHIAKEESEILNISSNLLTKDEIRKINEDFKLLDESLGENEKENLKKILYELKERKA